MSDNQYPVFESGQTLTAADLNVLRSFLHQRDRMVGRMVGFGINCGLQGTISGARLTISAGLAIDQTGEPLVLSQEATIDLPPTPVTPSYDFITTGSGGYSVVLELKDTVPPEPTCGQPDCAGHAELHSRDVSLRVVNGRVAGVRLEFEKEPLLKAEPIRLALDSTPLNSYTALRDVIADRLTNGGARLVQDALIAKLRQTSITSSDSPGVKGYKSGWLNTVLFATLELVRCEALTRIGCDRNVARAGVVLGWLSQPGGAWTWDCSYRHAWEPPTGLTRAFLGGSCSDPCGIARDDVEALLAGYAPPDPVPTGPIVDPVLCPKGSHKIGDLCFQFPYPGVDIDDGWKDKYRIPHDVSVLEKHWNPPHDQKWWTDPVDYYKNVQRWNYFGDGVLSMTQYLGQPGPEVQRVVESFINENGGVADVRVVSPAQAQAIDGYHPSGAGSPSDVLVLSVNNAGNVVATGRVAGQRNVAKVGAALPAAEAAIDDARTMATELDGMTRSLNADFASLHETVAGLQGSFNVLKGDFNAYKGGEFDQTGYGTRLNAIEGQVQSLREIDTRISKLEGSMTVLSSKGSGIIGVDTVIDRGTQGERINAAALADFAATTVDAMKSLDTVSNPNFTRYTRDAERAHAKFTRDLASGDSDLAAHSAFELLKTVRTMVKASGADAAFGRKLDTHLREISEAGGYT